jgi:hypothetical protein
MRASEAFVLGTITGAVALWFWGRNIEDYVGDMTRGVRAKAAEGMRALAETTAHVPDRSGSSLRRAEDFLQDTKTNMTEALRAGQEAIRPAPTTAEA